MAVLAATPAAAQAPEPEVPVLRGTATTVLPTLPPPTSTLDVVRRRGALRVGVSTFVPWAMTSKSGELIGFEIDLAKQLAEDLGVTAEFVPAAYPNLLDDLLADRFDIVVSGMAITPARALVANFSIPVGESDVRLVASREKAAGIRTARAGFDRPEVTIGVRAGAILRRAGREERVPEGEDPAVRGRGRRPRRDPDGQGHGLRGQEPRPGAAAGQGREQALPAARRSPREEPGGLRRAQGGDPDFLSFLDTWIRYHEDTGWLAERHKYWFGGFAWEDLL